MTNYRNKRRERSLQMQRETREMVDGSVFIPYVSYCATHGKKLFSKRDAKRAIRANFSPGMRKFPCSEFPAQGWFHIGHLPDNVRKGYISADEIYGKEQT